MENDELPTEDVQFEEYKKVAEDMQGQPVIIRTMDIGGDKELKCLDLPSEMNPFLGYRAIRISLNRPDIFKVQLRALLRASSFGDIHIMYPMIASVEEVKQANAMLEECKAELTAEGKAFNKDIKVGIMIEVPAAAVISPILAKYVDFFSIGTNDLCQYTLAVDRMNESIGSLYQPLHPGVLRLIKHVIDASHEQGKFTGMCGELASDPVATMILLGLGLDEFSMTASSIPLIKKILRSVSKAECEEVANKALAMDTAEEITEYAKSVLAEKGLL
jgi:phosphotransferase system enzyme I (PtsI)